MAMDSDHRTLLTSIVKTGFMESGPIFRPRTAKAVRTCTYSRAIPGIRWNAAKMP